MTVDHDCNFVVCLDAISIQIIRSHSFQTIIASVAATKDTKFFVIFLVLHLFLFSLFHLNSVNNIHMSAAAQNRKFKNNSKHTPIHKMQQMDAFAVQNNTVGGCA